MNRFAKGLVAAAAAFVPVSGFAFAPTNATMQSLLPTPPARAAAAGTYDVAEIYCVSIHWPTFKRGNHDVYSTTGASDSSTYCAIQMNGLITFMWF